MLNYNEEIFWGGEDHMKIKNLQINEEHLHDLYLKKLSLGEIQGPLVGKASIDKPWLKYYSVAAINSEPFNGSIYEHIKKKNILHKLLIL